MSNKHQCIIFTERGGPETLKLTTQDIPEPQSSQIRIKITAAGVSGADVLMREGVYPVEPPEFPFIGGYDIVGIVDKNGENAHKFTAGQRIAALTKIGGYAQYICLDENDVVLVPEGIDDVKAVSVVLNYITIYQILHRIAEVKSGETILIHGAGGGIGTAVLQLGKIAGLKMYGTDVKSHFSILEKLGCIPIDYREENVNQRIKELTGDGVDVILDPIGGANCFRTYPALKDPGRLVTFGAAFALKENPPNIQEVFFWWRASLALNLLSPSKKILTYAISTFKKENHQLYIEDLTTILNLLAAKKIDSIIAMTLPLSEAQKAHELLDKGGVTGKIV